MGNKLVIVRGGGDIASGSIEKLHNCGFNILILEIEKPSAIRRAVCYGEAVYENEMIIENIKSKKINSLEEIEKLFEERVIPVFIDPTGESIKKLKPTIVIDGILAKRNLGTNKEMASITVALGPGFIAGKDVDIVVETERGHNLGRLIFEGTAAENTGIPGNIAGYTKERVIHSHYDGIIKNVKEIGDIVSTGEVIARISDREVHATIDGVLRGIIRDGFKVTENFKIADIDPRINEQKNCFTISDKARSIGGGVLESVFLLMRKKEIEFYLGK